MGDLWITWSPRDYPEDKAHNWDCEPREMWGDEPVDKVTASVRADALTRRGYGQSYIVPANTEKIINGNYVRV